MKDSLFDESLRQRELFLEKIVSEKTAALDDCPPGKLRVVHRGQQSYYYWRTDPKDTNGSYISRKDSFIAQTLAQKCYDQKILCAAKEELTLIKKLRNKLSRQSVETCSLELEETYRDLIDTVVLSDEAFAKQWQNMPYRKKHYWDDEKEYYTKRGERVRSKSELIIANALNDQNIPYRYEYPVYNEVGKPIGVPDFNCLNVRQRKDYYWEHLGKLGDMKYANRNVSKLERYTLEGCFDDSRLILTFETNEHPLNTRVIEEKIRRFLL